MSDSQTEIGIGTGTGTGTGTERGVEGDKELVVTGEKTERMGTKTDICIL